MSTDNIKHTGDSKPQTAENRGHSSTKGTGSAGRQSDAQPGVDSADKSSSKSQKPDAEINHDQTVLRDT